MHVASYECSTSDGRHASAGIPVKLSDGTQSPEVAAQLLASQLVGQSQAARSHGAIPVLAVHPHGGHEGMSHEGMSILSAACNGLSSAALAVHHQQLHQQLPAQSGAEDGPGGRQAGGLEWLAAADDVSAASLCAAHALLSSSASRVRD